jgi:cytochrome P450
MFVIFAQKIQAITQSQSLAASGTSAMTSTHVLLDLLLSERKNYDKVQEEAIAAFSTYHSGSNVSLLTQLPCAGSAVRESMRLHPLFVPFPVVKVMQQGGITLPTGNHMPYGSFIGTPIFRVHMNSDSHPEPEEYLPFRFLQASVVPAETDISATAATDSFLSFGAGRHTW